MSSLQAPDRRPNCIQVDTPKVFSSIQFYFIKKSTFLLQKRKYFLEADSDKEREYWMKNLEELLPPAIFKPTSMRQRKLTASDIDPVSKIWKQRKLFFFFLNCDFHSLGTYQWSTSNWRFTSWRLLDEDVSRNINIIFVAKEVCNYKLFLKILFKLHHVDGSLLKEIQFITTNLMR